MKNYSWSLILDICISLILFIYLNFLKKNLSIYFNQFKIKKIIYFNSWINWNKNKAPAKENSNKFCWALSTNRTNTKPIYLNNA